MAVQTPSLLSASRRLFLALSAGLHTQGACSSVTAPVPRCRACALWRIPINGVCVERRAHTGTRCVFDCCTVLQGRALKERQQQAGSEEGRQLACQGRAWEGQQRQHNGDSDRCAHGAELPTRAWRQGQDAFLLPINIIAAHVAATHCAFGHGGREGQRERAHTAGKVVGSWAIAAGCFGSAIACMSASISASIRTGGGSTHKRVMIRERVLVLVLSAVRM